MTRRLIDAVLALVLLGACGGRSPTAPDRGDASGRWSGAGDGASLTVPLSRFDDGTYGANASYTLPTVSSGAAVIGGTYVEQGGAHVLTLPFDGYSRLAQFVCSTLDGRTCAGTLTTRAGASYRLTLTR